jgi:hypothetical protein
MKQASRRESDKATSQGRSAREKEPRVSFQPSNFATFQCTSSWSCLDERNARICGSRRDSCTISSSATSSVVR